MATSLPVGVRGQAAIADWTISVTDESNQTSEGISYRNTTYAVTGFSTASTSYGLGPTASSVYVRRNTDSNGNGFFNQSGVDNNNRSSTWNTQYSDADRLLGTYQSTMGGVLLNNNVVMGADNLFVNSNDPARKSAGNIERVDFYFGATTVNGSEGITIFDRGLAGAHDSVKIAIFTSWGTPYGTSAPAGYAGSVVTLNASNYGSNLDWNPVAGNQDSMDYTILRNNNGDNLTSLDEAVETSTQGVAGAFISFADLGIASGTTIYGYSIFAADVTTNVSNLADWRNATYYPTGTTDESGGIDLMSFNGRIARPVPEPSTYGALLLGGTLGFWWLSRRRSVRASQEA